MNSIFKQPFVVFQFIVMIIKLLSSLKVYESLPHALWWLNQPCISNPVQETLYGNPARGIILYQSPVETNKMTNLGRNCSIPLSNPDLLACNKICSHFQLEIIKKGFSVHFIGVLLVKIWFSISIFLMIEVSNWYFLFSKILWRRWTISLYPREKAS